MKQITQLFLIILCAGFFSPAPAAQSGKMSENAPDARVARALKQVKTEYEVVKDGMYKITYKTTENRAQSALISSTTERVFGAEMRLVFSFAQVNGSLPSPTIANLLLEENLDNFPNVWAIGKGEDGKFSIANMIYVSADSNGDTLDTALSSVMTAADKLEERLTKEDEL